VSGRNVIFTCNAFGIQECAYQQSTVLINEEVAEEDLTEVTDGNGAASSGPVPQGNTQKVCMRASVL